MLSPKHFNNNPSSFTLGDAIALALWEISFHPHKYLLLGTRGRSDRRAVDGGS